MKIYIIISLLMVFYTAHSHAAEEDYLFTDVRVGMFIASKHHFVSKDSDLNENHSDSYYLCVDSICAGRYENSISGSANVYGEKRHSNFLVYMLPLEKFGNLDISASFGIADGYKSRTRKSDYIPVVALNFKYYFATFGQFGSVSVIGLQSPNLIDIYNKYK